MKKIFCSFIFLLSNYLHSQNNIGIGTPNPAPSALIELSAHDKGFLMPRLTTLQRDNIPAPEMYLLIINTDIPCMQMYTGTWNCIGTTPSSPTTTHHCDSITLTMIQIDSLTSHPAMLVPAPSNGKYIEVTSIIADYYPAGGSTLPFFGGEFKIAYDPLCWSNHWGAISGQLMTTSGNHNETAYLFNNPLGDIRGMGLYISTDYNHSNAPHPGYVVIHIEWEERG